MGSAHSEAGLALEEADHGVVLSEVTVPVAVLRGRRGGTPVTSHLLGVRNPAGVSADCGHVTASTLHNLGPLTLQGTHLASSFILTTLLPGGIPAVPRPVTDHFLLQTGTRVWTAMPAFLNGLPDPHNSPATWIIWKSLQVPTERCTEY